MKIEISNRQRVKRINLKRIRRYLQKASKLLGLSGKKISFLLCDNKLIQKINRRFFFKNSPTDVISFPLRDLFEPDYLGEVVVSVEEAIARAKEYGVSWEEEFILYLVHGVLHLLGYRDTSLVSRKRMQNKQKIIMQALGLRYK